MTAPFQFGFVVKEMFFNVPKIIAAMDDKTRRCLAMTGGYAKKVMTTGMRHRAGVSKEGDFPSAHTSALRDNISFGYDVGLKRLIVGPTLLAGFKDREVSAAGLTVPELLNAGGAVRRRRVFDPKTKSIRPIRRNQAPIVWHYRPRPFVKRTMDKTLPVFLRNMERLQLKNTL